MAFLIGGANSAADTGYDIDNSLRFNEPDDPQLSITPGSAGDRKTWTVSFWHKVGAYNTYRYIFLSGASSPYDAIGITPNGGFAIYLNLGSGADPGLTTSALCRDPSAWYHFVCTVDTTQGTEANRIKMYINGVQQTSFSATNYPDEDAVFNTNNTVLQTVGGISAQAYLDGYVSEFYLIDGTAYAASDFGEFDEDSGIWKPKDAKDDLTFGTNGFYLEFKQTGTDQDSSGIGADTSGEDNHLAVTNLAATDQTTDTPTNNFCTLNPLAKGPNTTVTKVNSHLPSVTSPSNILGTMGVSSGKWYYEARCEDNYGGYDNFGFIVSDTYTYVTEAYVSGGLSWLQLAQIWVGDPPVKDSNSDIDLYDVNTKIVGCALDLDNNKVYFAGNGTYTESDNPSAGSGGYDIPAGMQGKQFLPLMGSNAAVEDKGVRTANFGHDSSFNGDETAQNNADGNGYGDFYYAPPSGFYALCTKNLAEFG